MKKVYFSSLIEEKFSEDFETIKNALEKHGIFYEFINNTKDIWCRDYMPVKVSENEYVQFRYEPDYLKDYEYLKTDPFTLHN